MNIAFFLTPKNEVVTLEKTITIGQAMNIMAEHRYTSVPVIDHKGRYVSTLSEGDILWHMKGQKNMTMDEIEHHSIRKVRRHHSVQAVSIDANIDSLVELASMQAFVPVVDDANTFIGIIKRSDIIHYCMEKMTRKHVALLA